MRYSKQREEILNIVKSSDNHLSADGVYEILKNKIPSISLGTVYRNLNKLYEEGLIKRIPICNNPDRFDKTIEDHYHFICDKCGDIYDVSSKSLETIKEDISNDTNHNIKSCDITFYGICHRCREERV